MLTSNLGPRITYFREKRGLQQNEIAAIVGIKPKYLRDIENGVENPRIALLARLAVALGIPIEELYKKEKSSWNF
ncbi:helix-turn-helix transcriptional regulator [Desulfitobacterium sp.]|uniref:helix-turn-helix domain-containing protein n=1 Tax=Desulfitobacterium sp. TaxID=49981 RepID=UPI002CCA52F5|nr:helix-turn-helix transcriptional regulator [Desulfitobacterium sp.]HVJ48018.1 helix-turn-helix transcriptional regulator [Desulfitobacterium sp.]